MTFTAIQGIMMLVLVLIRPPNSMPVMPFEAAAKEALMIVDVGLGWIFKQMESTCDSFSLIDLHSLTLFITPGTSLTSKSWKQSKKLPEEIHAWAWVLILDTMSASES
mmetsp:Transcript_90217/g.125359  ORF Transcript_90217/g.125359 Transcript_90217/m.125359 type:complete len:108 (-) Transcript_90217:149-472(-)